MASSELKNFVSFCRKIVCVGRNYRDHALELKNPVPDKPLLFLKPPSCFLKEGQGPIKIPPTCAELHHEVELGVVIGKAGSCIREEDAMAHVGGYALALDMTARDIQDEIKRKGYPWLLAKCWDTFAPVGEFIPSAEVRHPQNVNFWLKVDGQLRQRGNTNEMIFPIAHVISYASSIMTLEKGDFIMTGTPAGVGRVTAGQVIECGIDGMKSMTFSVQ